MKAKLILSGLLTTSLLLSAASTTPLTKEQAAVLRKDAKETLATLPEKMPGGDKDSPALISLGKKLFFEKKLSANESQSCNTCHRIDANKAGVDNDTTSLGAFGKRGGRNSPTVLNAGFQLAQFWDGRAHDLTAQAKGPVLNPVEMAMPDEQTVLKRLSSDKEYQQLFGRAFAGGKEPITYENVAQAIAAFERTLKTQDRFDEFLKGNDQALSAKETRGLQLFVTIGCTTCHNGAVLGGNAYHKAGLMHPYETTDAGRFDVTKDEDDKQKFKVPMLRNIALTGPYFHDGKLKSLEEAVKTMAYIQLDKKLTDAELSDIVAFLQSLTDKELEKASLKAR